MFLSGGMFMNAQAESVLLKLPYGLEVGQKVPLVIKNKCREFKEENHKCAIEDKFFIELTDSDKIKKLGFSKWLGKFPKSWRALGLSIHAQTAPEELFRIIKNEEGVENLVANSKTASGVSYYEANFDIGKKYSVWLTVLPGGGIIRFYVRAYDPDEY